MTWTTVEPLVDEPQPGYWPVFKPGQRVRVRLSGECDVQGIGPHGEAASHVPGEDGQPGTIVVCPDIARDGYCQYAEWQGHSNVVEYDGRVHYKVHTARSGHYAACELELLT